MKGSALKELYISELRDLYNAEKQLTKALPKMAKAATADDLRAGFEDHLEQTKGHVERLEQIFKELREKPTMRLSGTSRNSAKNSAKSWRNSL